MLRFTSQSKPAGPSRRNRVAYSVLIGIILLTIPCYLVGFAALFILQRPGSEASASPTPTSRGLPTLIFPTPTLGALLPGFTSPIVMPSPVRPTLPPVSNPPTTTEVELPTAIATDTPTPIATDTATPLPTPTDIPSPTPTETETPTPGPEVETPTPVPPATSETPAP